MQILVNNASGWVADTLRPRRDADRFGRTLQASSRRAPSTRSSAVDARAPALLIAEFARRHVARGGQWGRIVGLTSGEASGFPEEVSYGAAKAAQVNLTLSAATELARFGVTANVVHPPDHRHRVDQPRGRPPRRRSAGDRVATPRQVADGDRLSRLGCRRPVTGNVIRLR